MNLVARLIFVTLSSIRPSRTVSEAGADEVSTPMVSYGNSQRVTYRSVSDREIRLVIDGMYRIYNNK
jgi:hypothetical protein